MSAIMNSRERTDERVEIDGLIAALQDSDYVRRHEAREALVSCGNAAVEPLVQLLGNCHAHVRWEAVKALGHFADPKAVSALVDALDDEDWDVRWTAAKSLSEGGYEALCCLLTALACRPNSPEFLQSARHVLLTLRRGALLAFARPVLAALKNSSPEIAIHLAAYTALHELISREQTLRTWAAPAPWEFFLQRPRPTLEKQRPLRFRFWIG
jgi:hypothetical protein